MSMIIDGTNGLTFNNSTTQASAGNVLQVVNSTSYSSSSTSSSSFVTTGFGVSITPKFATSKILVTVNSTIYMSGSNKTGLFTIYRNSTNLAAGTATSALSGMYNSAGDLVCPITLTFLDSPATTSATTYTAYFSVVGATVYFGFAPGAAATTGTVITAQEIAA